MPERTAAAAESGAKKSPPPTKGEVLKDDIESLDAKVQSGLEELARSTAEFAAERQKWDAMDRSVASARTVNAALLARNKEVVALYETKLSGHLDTFRQRLGDAPAVFREMIEERRRLLAAATLDVEKSNYTAMIETCEAAAALCERRSQELFGEVKAGEGSSERSQRANATNLRRTIENMKKLQAMHQKWDETFNSYPSALDSPSLANWFTTLSLYSEDLAAFSKSVDKLKEVMKQKTLPAPKANKED
ncbi:hypothetical protein [Gemmata obscuriglobus]|uniref:hypothetical protein n=1 Tax=Gemmata obscuriglobus TaxID=114 RepID=UPI0011CD4866|nr:hypothetical protein [Gemmata obscuriglobus]